MNDTNFEQNLLLALNTDGSSTDYRNDRERPYNGQPHTVSGIRGSQIVSGLTMRDISDCFFQALLKSSNDPELQSKVFEISDDPDIGKGTKYAAKGTWRKQDVYKVDLSKVDPIAVAQNLTCFIEHYMEIFPNIHLDGIPDINDVIKTLTGE